MRVEKADIIRVTHKVENFVDKSVVVVPITLDNVADGLNFNTPEEIEQFKYFLSIGHKGYYAYYNGVCALRTWIFVKKEQCLVGSNFIYDLPENEYFSGWSKTNPSFYKLGIFTVALDYAIKDNPDKVIAGYVASDNIGSLKGTQKVGFQTMERYNLYLVFGRGFKVKTYDCIKGKTFRLSFGRTIYPY
ncbi:MAG: hypothetical protein M9916_04090 [Crocinitomicaceae bacterium]|jgi:hypothetical protein|nr:hypothetical protein [Crocinitomicaceae bacterium]